MSIILADRPRIPGHGAIIFCGYGWRIPASAFLRIKISGGFSAAKEKRASVLECVRFSAAVGLASLVQAGIASDPNPERR